MYKDNPVCEQPENEEAKIWRYMDFTKFVSLLEKSSLFFSRADKLGDPFEGSFSRANVRMRPEVYKDKIPEGTLRDLSEFRKMYIKFTAINCWHLNEYESAAMWKLYLKSDDGIAILSTLNRLKNSINDKNYDIYIGQVKYIDYNNDWLPEGHPFLPFLHKRSSFSHEKEIRAIIQSIPIKSRGKERGQPNFNRALCNDGIYITVDLDLLIHKIYLAPTSPKWLFELVKSVTGKYNLDKEVYQSSLDDVPVY